MPDDDKCANGNDWELVSLTASTYAAAPGPILPLPHTDKTEVPHFDSKSDSPAALFVSGHFNFPTKEEAGLLNEPDCKAQVMLDDNHLDRSYYAKCKLDHDLPNFSFLDKHITLSLDDVMVGDAMGLGGLGLSGEEQTRFHTSSFHTLDAGSDLFRKAHHSTDAATQDIAAQSRPPGAAPKGPVGVSRDAYNAKDQSKIPSEGEAWWKKTFSFLCNNAKESVNFRFIFVAATIVGLAVPGQRWQRKKFRIHFYANNERIGCNVGPLGQVKCGMVGGSQQSSVAPPLPPGYGALGI